MISNSVASNPQTVIPGWQWQNCGGISYLTCSLLSSWQHGFFTKEFEPRTPEDLTPVLQPEATTYRLKQVHGNLVLTPPEIELALDDRDSFADGDGIITDKASQSAWVASADCTPVLIGDLVTGTVSAIHAGWRGTSIQIVPKAIARFLDFGSSKDDLRIALGPAIAGAVYQVDEEVAIEVGKSIIAQTEASEILAALKDLPNSAILNDDTPGKVRLDVRRINQIQIEQLGISSEQIALAPWCTFQQSDLFFSYRRTAEKKVQWSGIVSN